MAKFCAECGSKLDDNVRFCENCGAPADAAEQPAVPAPAAPPQPAYRPEPQQPAYRPELQPAPPSEPSYPYAAPVNADRQPYPYATPINAGQKAAYASAPDTPGASDKKSHLGLGIAVAVIAVVLIAAAIIVFFIWKPFDKKDDDNTPAATENITEDTTLSGDADATIAEPATESPTYAPSTQAPTAAITDADKADIMRAAAAIVKYGYSRSANIDNYLEAVFEYRFALSVEDRQNLYNDVKDIFFDDVDEYKEAYGDDYEISVISAEADPMTDDELQELKEYYVDTCNVSAIEMAATIRMTVSVTGSKESDTEVWTWDYIKAGGSWYPVC